MTFKRKVSIIATININDDLEMNLYEVLNNKITRSLNDDNDNESTNSDGNNSNNSNNSINSTNGDGNNSNNNSINSVNNDNSDDNTADIDKDFEFCENINTTSPINTPQPKKSSSIGMVFSIWN